MIPRHTILVVDDDSSILEVLSARLEAAGYSTVTASDGFDALTLLHKQKVDLIISDMKMPEMDGMELYEEVKKKNEHIPVIFLTAYGTIPDAVNAVKAGAVDYVSKPFDGRQLVEKIRALLSEKTVSIPTLSRPPEDGFYWGKNKEMLELKEITSRVARSSANVLILGESGVGKEGVARLLHQWSGREKSPYIVVDCGSTPPGILESELFGHVKGAFTNAVQNKKGLIEAAHGGTLFLDEIGNISADMQNRLLRFLEDKKIRRVGAVEEKEVQCRVISATNADLPASIKKGSFRQDLYYRLRVVTLEIPPLRKRKEDIPALSEFFLSKISSQEGLGRIRLATETLEMLLGHNWPGNVRELKNCLEAGAVLCGENIIYPDDLQLMEVQGSDLQNVGDDSFSIENSEREAIIRALKETAGVQTRAAELLDISRRSLHYKIKKYDISVSEYK